MPAGGNYADAARRVSETAIEKAGLPKDISTTVATGWGAGAVDFADRTVADISCHAAGIFHFFPLARTVVDIGSQFSRAIKLGDDGKVMNFVQKEVRGRERQISSGDRAILHMNVADIGTLSLESAHPVEFTTGCAVFAESKAVSRIAEGASPADIWRSAQSDGGQDRQPHRPSRCQAPDRSSLAGRQRHRLGDAGSRAGRKILVLEEPQVSAAVGAAILG
jgi:activator of 2-hydroxyglutaryl-CoA dehydratase